MSVRQVDHPALLLVNTHAGTIHVSDPTAKLDRLTITTKSGKNPEVIKSIALPSGSRAGTSIQIALP